LTTFKEHSKGNYKDAKKDKEANAKKDKEVAYIFLFHKLFLRKQGIQ
jgi:hypothetical protein